MVASSAFIGAAGSDLAFSVFTVLSFLGGAESKFSGFAVLVFLGGAESTFPGVAD